MSMKLQLTGLRTYSHSLLYGQSLLQNQIVLVRDTEGAALAAAKVPGTNTNVFTTLVGAEVVTYDLTNKYPDAKEVRVNGQGKLVDVNGVEITGLSTGGLTNRNVALYGSVTPSNLSVFRAKKAAVKAGTAHAKVLMVSDSTGAGSYGPGSGGFALARVYCEAQLLANSMRALDLPCSSENWFGDAGALDLTTNINAYNPLVTLGSGWASDASIVTLGGRPLTSTTASTSLTYGGWSDCDTFEVYYRRRAGGGSFTMSRTGDASSAVISTAGTEGVVKVTFTGALSPNVLSIDHDATTNPVTILGIDAYNSAEKQIRFLSAGFAGSRVAQWADAASPYSARNMLAAVQPDLVIFGPGINDWVNNTTIGNAATPGTFTGDLNALIVAAKATGADVALRTGYPSYRTSAPRARQKAMVDAMRSLAVTHNILCQDTWTRWGSQEVNPILYYNTLHPNATGLKQNADTLAAILHAA